MRRTYGAEPVTFCPVQMPLESRWHAGACSTRLVALFCATGEKVSCRLEVTMAEESHVPEFLCRHLSRTFACSELPALLRTVADDIDRLGPVLVMDVVVSLSSAEDEATITVYYDLDSTEE
jgi:hypothetical protein